MDEVERLTVAPDGTEIESATDSGVVSSGLSHVMHIVPCYHSSLVQNECNDHHQGGYHLALPLIGLTNPFPVRYGRC